MGKTKKSTQATTDAGAHKAEQVSSKPAKGAKAAVEQQPAAANKPAAATEPTKKRAKDEIDEIFGKSKKKAPAAAAASDAEDEGDDTEAAAAPNPEELLKVAKQVEEARQKAKRPKVEGSKDDIFGQSTGKARKHTEEGYAIYGEDELGLGKKGGDTPLCPFDCDCCY